MKPKKDKKKPKKNEPSATTSAVASTPMTIAHLAPLHKCVKDIASCNKCIERIRDNFYDSIHKLDAKTNRSLLLAVVFLTIFAADIKSISVFGATLGDSKMVTIFLPIAILYYLLQFFLNVFHKNNNISAHKILMMKCFMGCQYFEYYNVSMMHPVNLLEYNPSSKAAGDAHEILDSLKQHLHSERSIYTWKYMSIVLFFMILIAITIYYKYESLGLGEYKVECGFSLFTMIVLCRGFRNETKKIERTTERLSHDIEDFIKELA